jgi:FOG: Ankyrin repeat
MSGIRRSNCGDVNTDLLFFAAGSGDLAEVKRLVVGCGVDPNIQDNDGNTPLHRAVIRSRREIIKLLLEHGADPNIQNNYGGTPLHYAAKKCRVSVARVLLDYGADPTIRDNKGKTPLNYGSNCEEIIEELRRRGSRTTVYE